MKKPSFTYFRAAFLKNKNVILITFLFGVIYSLTSLVNHYNFRTNAGDLGIYNQAIYDYAHFRANYNTVWFGNTLSNLLSDHFSLFQILVSPLFWVFKSYTLLIVQIISVLFGGVGVYKYIKLISKNEKLSLLALAHFFSIWGIYSALNFDYHDNVVASMFVPWIIYYLKKEKFRAVFLFFTLLIISRENMIIWAVFLCLGLLSVNYKSIVKRKVLLGLLIYALVFLVLTFTLFMPSLTQEVAGYTHFSFSVLGPTAKEALINIFQHPFDVLESLFTNHLNKASADGVKNEFFLTLILSGGFILLRKPQYLFILLPIFGQKLFHDNYTHWALSYHYSIEFAPVLSIALFEYFAQHQFKQTLKLAGLAVLVCFTINIIKIEDRLPSWYDNVGLAFYSKKHYETPYSVKEINVALKMIPDDVVVSAESNLVPHLADRKIIFVYPRIGNAQYIVLSPKDRVTFPLNIKEYEQYLGRLNSSYLWKRINNNACLIFKKNPNGIPSEVQINQKIKLIQQDSVWLGYVNRKVTKEHSLADELRGAALIILAQENNHISRRLMTSSTEKLNKIFTQINENRIVVVAVKDEATRNLPKNFVDKFDTKYKTNLKALKFRESYIAVFEKGKLIYETSSSEKVLFNKYVNKHYLAVVSSGGADVESACAIKINGIDYAINLRGLNVVSLDPYENVRSFHFDTYQNKY